MKMNDYLTAILSLALLASCSGDEVRQQGDGEGDPAREVTFLAYARKGAQTRAEETTSLNIENFNAFGIWSGNDEPLPYISPAVVTGGQGDWKYAPKQTWPEAGRINFYAYSPHLATNLTAHYDADHYDAAHRYVTYTVPPLASQQDLLVAVKPNVNCSAPAPVSLNFQHALARVRLKARLAFKDTDPYNVLRVRFVHLSNSGKLALTPANVPDGEGFAYNDILPRNPLVLWEDHNDPETNYEFTFDPAVVVSDPQHYQDVIAGNQSFLVLPQTTQMGDAVPMADYNSPTDPADPADDKLYIRIDFSSVVEPSVIKVKYYAVREPLDPAKKLPLTLEAGRSYTFVVNLSGADYIDFADVHVLAFNEAFDDGIQYIDEVDVSDPPIDLDPALTEAYMPQPHSGFAGSNIYWDEANQWLTFDDVGVTAHQNYIGLYFKWGSLVGISPRINAFDAGTVLYIPAVNGNYVKTDAGKYVAGNWAGITHAAGTRNFDAGQQPIAGVTDLRKSGYVTYLTTLPSERAAYRGDICAYLSWRRGVPEGHWRMPTSAELEGSYAKTGNYVNIGGASSETGAQGLGPGRSRTYAGKTIFFAAGGFRNPSTVQVGLAGGVWSASPSPDGITGRCLVFTETTVTPAATQSRENAFPVRCVKKKSEEN
jgi:hypothetical protein